MKKVINLVFIATLISLIGFSCKKHRAKKLAGFYECKVDIKTWTFSPTWYDTSYQKTIEVKRKGKEIVIEEFDLIVHIDSVWDSKIYKIRTSKTLIELTFTGENLFYRSGTYALGGGGETSYYGKKID